MGRLEIAPVRASTANQEGVTMSKLDLPEPLGAPGRYTVSITFESHRTFTEWKSIFHDALIKHQNAFPGTIHQLAYQKEYQPQ